MYIRRLPYSKHRRKFRQMPSISLAFLVYHWHFRLCTVTIQLKFWLVSAAQSLCLTVQSMRGCQRRESCETAIARQRRNSDLKTPLAAIFCAYLSDGFRNLQHLECDATVGAPGLACSLQSLQSDRCKPAGAAATSPAQFFGLPSAASCRTAEQQLQYMWPSMFPDRHRVVSSSIAEETRLPVSLQRSRPPHLVPPHQHHQPPSEPASQAALQSTAISPASIR